MADNIPFSPSVGASFQVESNVVENIASGQTGTLISLPEIAGKVYRIFVLSATTSDQSGISLITNGNTLIDTKTLAPNGALEAIDDTEFFVFGGFSSTNTNNGRNYFDVVECSSFSIVKDAGNTTQAIQLSYAIGEYK